MMFTVAVLGVTAALYAFWPMLDSNAAPSNCVSVSSLPLDKDDLLSQIADLDLEFAAGKIPREVYGTLREELLADAAVKLREERENRGSPSQS